MPVWHSSRKVGFFVFVDNIDNKQNDAPINIHLLKINNTLILYKGISYQSLKFVKQ